MCGRSEDSAETTALALMHEAGLTLPQMVALSMLRHAGPSPITAVADKLGLSMSATSTLVQRLVEEDLVTRTEDPDDRRQKLVDISKPGATLIDRLTAERSAELSRGLAALPPELRDDFLDVLGRVVENLREKSPR
jgi:DNA-binding MarR family transcriptional regulator